ncbi:MAG: 16S rRNA (cytosine(1402)-N(4))-methyltransferase RsmH [Candidatus Levybacteria bacterium]|nr:16S rRNA (cytosine(1402)-N(4))-methyltransferase RsmH [Candidatus Levybacteria bacterium]
MDTYHKSVLLQEVLSFLKVEGGKKYIDATLGGGGHTKKILELGGEVLSIDVDQDAIDYVRSKIKDLGRLTLVRGNFKDIGEIARLHGFEKVAGILFDLGVSSHQLDTASRGFSFQKEGPLDMRMDKNLSLKAADLINVLTKGELYELYRRLGEERHARAIASAVVSARQIKPIATTTELAKIVQLGAPKKFSNINQATKVFQALRIAVNDELNSLEVTLPKSLDLLEKEGRLVVISFHSLEDRIVKNAFRFFSNAKKGKIITKKPITPNWEEIKKNKRSRSARMRVFEKL